MKLKIIVIKIQFVIQYQNSYTDTKYGLSKIIFYKLNSKITYILSKPYSTRGLSGYRARRRMADSGGPVLVAGLSLNK